MLNAEEQKCVGTDVEALAGHREIHALAERIFVCCHLHALLTVELRAIQAEAFPTQGLMQNRKCMRKITCNDNVMVLNHNNIM